MRFLTSLIDTLQITGLFWIVTIMVTFMMVAAAGTGFAIGKKHGIAEGRSQALKTNPVSEELEMICAGLWIGEQNKKYWEKENAKK